MQIRILGTRGEIKISKPGYQKHSGILIDNKILLDIGEKEYLQYDPQIIFITHLHPDHAYFVSAREKINMHLPVYGPEKLLNQEIKIINKPLLMGDYKITPVPVIHSLKVKSQGYVIEKGNKRIFYSGDIVSIDKKFYHQLFNLDVVITEASFIRKGGLVRRDINNHRYGHAGIPDLVKLFKEFTNRIIFTHFGSWFMKNIEAGKENFKNLEETHLELELACDGKEFIV